jgi:hypothetical protein
MEIDRKETPEEELNRKIRRISCIKSKFKGITQQDIDARIKIYLDKIAANTPPESEEKILDRGEDYIQLEDILLIRRWN